MWWQVVFWDCQWVSKALHWTSFVKE